MSVENQEAVPARARLMAVVRVVVSVTLLAVLLARVDRGALLESVRHASIPWLAIALVVYFVHILTGAWRWGLLLSTQNVHVPRRELLSSLLVSYFFNNFLPSNIGGDVIRIRDTARRRAASACTTLAFLYAVSSWPTSTTS